MPHSFFRFMALNITTLEVVLGVLSLKAKPTSNEHIALLL